ncbi:hypothetical protein GUJ93_ZPchr0004g39887 [Zizania palustris]|uniref:Uncharacterized protein n=1 Tax=Zizania palustris TaxID=103762 RepID=A0A8J5S0M9_ZIZPA|nr:hypothetical protein GUJ93_ZPchr0004g39887 [Zizania palustris]
MCGAGFCCGALTPRESSPNTASGAVGFAAENAPGLAGPAWDDAVVESQRRALLHAEAADRRERCRSFQALGLLARLRKGSGENRLTRVQKTGSADLVLWTGREKSDGGDSKRKQRR